MRYDNQPAVGAVDHFECRFLNYPEADHYCGRCSQRWPCRSALEAALAAAEAQRARLERALREIADGGPQEALGSYLRRIAALMDIAQQALAPPSAAPSVDEWGSCSVCGIKLYGGSHYHCGNCGGESGMYGHFSTREDRFTCAAPSD
jgi:hypothetical protein